MLVQDIALRAREQEPRLSEHFCHSNGYHESCSWQVNAGYT